MKFEKKEITKKSENISDWYTDVVLRAELADYAPVKGTMVIRPYGYAIWEKVQGIFNKMFKEKGVQNAYFPLFIPLSFLEKEKEHVEGFSPELAIVTTAGGETLKEPLVVRPTSETIMYAKYKDWIHSWRDLPVLINQWNNVVRWEKRTYLFLRTTEFLWQEGHTAHEDEEGAIEMAVTALEWYRKVYEDYYAIPVYTGIKSSAEKFAGAKTTYTIEALMPDGKALQGSTSHNLGQNFSKAFEISFQDQKGGTSYVWQTSWGFTTRSLGALFLTHGDDNGLILPPKIAPVKVAIIPIFGKDDGKVITFSRHLKKRIEETKSEFLGDVELWENPNKTFGWRVNEAELKGVPITITVGMKEVESGVVTIKARIPVESSEQQVKEVEVGNQVELLLSALQSRLFSQAKEFLVKNTHIVSKYEEFKSIMADKRGFIQAYWCEEASCEQSIKNETKASTRCLPIGSLEGKGECIYCSKPAKHQWLFAQSY